ncbi:MAG: FHIPEP family type III secretion protein [Nitratireductor sp.]
MLHAETGLRLPGFGIEEDGYLTSDSIRIMLDGVSGFDADIPRGKIVAVCDRDILEINAIQAERVDPKWGFREAYWVSATVASMLSTADVPVLDATEMIVRAGGRFIRRNGGRIVGYRQIQTVIRELGSEHENLAAQISQTISAVQLLNLVRKLLQEGVPLMPRRILFEALLEASVTAVSSEHLIRSARSALARQLCASTCDENNVIAGYVLEPGLEIALRDALIRGNDENSLQPAADVSGTLLAETNSMLESHDESAPSPVIVTTDDLRWPLSSWLRQHRVEARVMAFHEISSEFNFVPVGALGSSLPQPRYNDEMAA